MNEPRPDEVSIDVRIAGRTVHARAALPPARARADQLLPIVQAVVNAEVDFALGEAAIAGAPVTCCRGCSACCRAQPVPVTPPEAYALLLLVEALPEPEQSALRRRFKTNRQTLEEAGLVVEYARPRDELTPHEARSIAERYFALKLACPFLVDDACSIYEARPFVCRQYVVTTPATRCADPFHNLVTIVPMSLKPATATLQIFTEIVGRPQFTIPLALALEYAAEHRAELERTFDAEELARRWIGALFHKAIGPPMSKP